MADFVGKMVVVLLSWHFQSCHAVPWLWVGFPSLRQCCWLCRGNQAKEPCRGLEGPCGGATVKMCQP